MQLQDKVAVVTGAAQGIGREYALRFAREGAAVAITDIREDQARAVAREIVAAGGDAVAVNADITSQEQMDAMAQQAMDRFGRIDALVNNAAIYYDLNMGDTSIEYCKKVLDVNLFGVVIASRAVFPHMKRQRSGSIVNISSLAAYPARIGWSVPNPNLDSIPVSGYGIGKAAMIYVTQVMAKSLGVFNIRVNAIAPGLTTSEATRKHSPSDRIEAQRPFTALGRTLEPADLTGAAVFLVSDDSALMTGQTLVVDGGVAMVG